MVGPRGKSVVTTVDVAYLPLDPTMDPTATAPACTLSKLEDKGYDHGYGKHEISVMSPTGVVPSVAGAGTRRSGTELTTSPVKGEVP